MASKVVLITGASRGIGAAIATEFARNGFSVILTSKNHPQLLTTLKQTLTSLYGIDCMTFVGDIGDPAQVDLLFKASDVLRRDLRRMDVVLDRVVLGRQAERVPADRIKDVVAF